MTQNRKKIKTLDNKHKNTALLKELELDKISTPDNIKPAVKGDLIRIGIIIHQVLTKLMRLLRPQLSIMKMGDCIQHTLIIRK